MVACYYQMTKANYLQENEKDFELSTKLKQQLGKAPAKNSILHIYEVMAVHDYELNEDMEN